MSRKRKKIGLPPGSIIFTGNQKVEKIQIHYLKYDANSIEESEQNNHSSIALHQSKEELVDWYDIRGIHDTDLIQTLGNTFDIHPLILENIVDTQQRPKFEEYDKGIFIILKALNFNLEKQIVIREQIAIYFRKGLVLTFQEDHTDLFEPVRKRIHSGKGKVRQKGADYLAYALTDNLVDHYYTMLDTIEEQIETLEDNLLEKPDSNTKERIHYLKKEIIRIRKSIAPLREAISRFSKLDSLLIEESTVNYIRDLYDHTIQIMDSVDNFRDMLNGLQDLYISEISFRMNQVMQVLTIITTIFVPLSFLAGLYGMNFEYIPELHFRYGYFVLLGVMFLVAIGLLLGFKRKNWL